MKSPPAAEVGLPLVVHVAFSGKRRLHPSEGPTPLDPAAFHEAVGSILTERLRHLHTDLGLPSHHRICAVSSLAAGGDLLFASATRQLDWWHRVLLPQPLDDFLGAGSAAERDFSDAEAEEARRLCGGNNVIERRVASVSEERNDRFQDVNIELVRVCDVLICLLKEGPSVDKPAGTRDTLDLAIRWGRPVLELRLGVDPEGRPFLSDTWHWPERRPGLPLRFNAPTLPSPLDQISGEDCSLQDGEGYRNTLKAFSSAVAQHRQNFFKRAALAVVGAHVLATFLALIALSFHTQGALPFLLTLEVLLLIGILGFHEWLHRVAAVREWAMARLTAEIRRSAQAAADIPHPLRHFFDLPMPEELRPLLRTLNAIHLAGIARGTRNGWEEAREHYVGERLQGLNGQCAYYKGKLARAQSWLTRAHFAFYVGSVGALLATSVKLAMVLHLWEPPDPIYDLLKSVLGFLAVLLPVVAVAALSLAAAFDLEARVHTYEDMLHFLEDSTPRLQTAASPTEFATLALRIEARLLGETVNWHQRRAFTGVA